VKNDDDPQEDVDSLLKMIGKPGKKEGPDKTIDSRNTPTPNPELSGTGASQPGDFSALLKKLGMAKKDESGRAVSPPSATQSPSVSGNHDDSASLDFDDLLEEAPPALEGPGVAGDGPEYPGREGGQQEVVSEEKIPDRSESPVEASSPAPPVTVQPDARPPPPETIIEIIDEDPKSAIRRKKVKSAASAAAQPVQGSVIDEKIITVDQISDLSGLILPKGATFKIDEIQLHGRINAFETTGSGSLPREMDEIFRREFSTAGFKDLDIGGDSEAEKEKTLSVPKKFSISSLFNAIRSEQEEYDPKRHSPLVDLVFTPSPGLEEMEMYPVNEPYAYVRITYDHSTHEYTYHVLEPVLTEPEKELLKELKERLFETLDINTKDISKEEAKKKLRDAADEIMRDFGIRLTPPQREKILYNMHKDFLGDGLIDAIMHDKYIEDISCDGVNTTIFAFHASYESMKTTLLYHSAEDLDSFVTKLAQRAGKYISIAEPILDATMQDGSRIQMTLGQEVTAHGSTFTIRKFKDEPITPTDLIEWHTFAPLSIAYIWLCVENGKSAIFAGGTASGKTTALNAISLFIPPMAKIVSLEDTRELKLPHPNWIPSITRDSFDTAGRGEINMYELLRAAMRQRPEYIIVGEVRGKECQTLFQAMSTGHITYSTTHADSVASVVHRIENPPMDVPRNMLSALDFICIQVQARVGGKRIRRNKQIVEILDIDPRTNELITNEVFKWRSATDEISYSGKSYLLEEIMEAKGWSETRMREELKRRQEVLEWMRIKKIRHYKDVAKILISYHRDPEGVIERVRKDLYE